MRNMMKRAVAIVVVGAGLWAQGPTEAQANLLRNPGFENGLSDWTDLFGCPTILTDTVVYSGSLAATKSVCTVTGQDYWSQLYQEIEVSPGEPIYATAYLKSTFVPVATAKGGLIAQFMDADGNVLGPTVRSREVGGQTDWRLVELTAAGAPEGTVKVRLSVYLWALRDDTPSMGGGLFMDDLVFLKVFQPLAPQLELLNPGFENGLHDWIELFGFPSFLSTTQVHSGTYAAAKRVGSLPGQDYWSQLRQELLHAAGSAGEASLFVKTDFPIVSQAQAGIFVEFLSADGQVISSLTRGVTGETDWREVAVSWTEAPEGTAQVRISAFIYAPAGDGSVGRDAFYDDVTVALTTP